MDRVGFGCVITLIINRARSVLLRIGMFLIIREHVRSQNNWRFLTGLNVSYLISDETGKGSVFFE